MSLEILGWFDQIGQILIIRGISIILKSEQHVAKVLLP